MHHLGEKVAAREAQRPAETPLHPTVFAVERLPGLSDALLGPRTKEDTMGSTEEEIRAKALLRYFVISAYLAAEPPRGQKGAMLRQLASKVWHDENGEAFTAEAETIRAWVRRYKKGGLAALEDKRRTCSGLHALTEDEAELLCALKEEVPERSIERVIAIAERMKELGDKTDKQPSRCQRGDPRVQVACQPGVLVVKERVEEG